MNEILRIKESGKIVFPEISYQIVGAAFSVFNEMGWGFTEKDYQKALAEELVLAGLKPQRSADSIRI